MCIFFLRIMFWTVFSCNFFDVQIYSACKISFKPFARHVNTHNYSLPHSYCLCTQFIPFCTCYHSLFGMLFGTPFPQNPQTPTNTTPSMDAQRFAYTPLIVNPSYLSWVSASAFKDNHSHLSFGKIRSGALVDRTYQTFVYCVRWSGFDFAHIHRRWLPPSLWHPWTSPVFGACLEIKLLLLLHPPSAGLSGTI